ncbi:MAG TPA: periplasmic heavy metal sensor [Syntrophorhabdaceae bacterium]|nr:periplasmic heavy metal sensor [Syntrophorhabdaceae bacterium]HOT41552.1 periplasmic heavy metal sensor [Syntrophorhabdaceae bacterium]HPC65850.1 periplasmic heavy metal sensor [Syntrophorhabdaceae bacterium]HPP41702.1 periplasmic heavy metal sensor [Syntrophorhabdaceae bacterium]HQE79524.1 periplasmic heavy metal sensor [Syntrophorhabdaceae bacterium]
MKRKRLMIGIMVLMFLALTTTVFAFGPRGGRDYGDLCRMQTELNLTKEQSERLWQIRERYNTDTEKLRYEIFQKGLELKSLYGDPKADKTTILNKQKELNALKLKLQDRRAQMRVEQREVLTPEQLNKLNQFRPGPGYGMMGYGKPGRGRGIGPAGY